MISGVYVAMITPLDRDRRIDESWVRALIQFYVDSGVSGVFANSSVGESAHFDRGESERLLDLVAEETAGRLELYAGVTATSSVGSIALAQRAHDLGYDGVVSAPPYFYRPSDDAIVQHYRELSSAAECPIIVYNVPLFAPPISREVLTEILELPRIVAIKDSSGSYIDLINELAIIERRGLDVAVLVGREEMLYAALLSGAQGCMVASAGIVPEALIRITELVKAGSNEPALHIQKRVLELVNTCFDLEFPLGFKAALSSRLPGFPVTTRRPLSARSLAEHASHHVDLTGAVARVLDCL